MNQYATRDTESLGDLYIHHVEAMTAEGLHEKNRIAAELAYRDSVIASLLSRIEQQKPGEWMDRPTVRGHYWIKGIGKNETPELVYWSESKPTDYVMHVGYWQEISNWPNARFQGPLVPAEATGERDGAR